MINTTLTHHGIRGMRWGVRRYQNKDGSLTLAGKKRADVQEKVEREIDVKTRRTMSDDDLRKRIARLKLEQEYKTLVESDIAPGRKFVSEALVSGGKKVLTAAAAGAMAYGVKVAMTKEFDRKEAASYIASNPNKKK